MQLRRFLWPLSLIYGGIVRLRNSLYDSGRLKSSGLDFPLIGIGNLSAGGTGKTPMTEYLLRHLIDMQKHPAVLSRGYGRKTKGYILATHNNASAAVLGDEPYQMYRKFPDIAIAVSEDRVIGAISLIGQVPELDVIVLDDCYQHRAISPQLMILLMDYSRPFYTDSLLPSGDLREPVVGKSRADLIIVTKAPETISEAERKKIIDRIVPQPHQQVLFSHIRYAELLSANGARPLHNPLNQRTRALLFTGIAHPEPLEAYLRSIKIDLHHIRFGDHHHFNSRDISSILEAYNASDCNMLITTEKDIRRLESEPALMEILSWHPMYYIPIEFALNERDSKILHTRIASVLQINL